MIAVAPYDWLIPLCAAPFIGSFLSVLAVRLPVGEDVVASRSRCRSCGKALGPLELVPLLSWAVQRGRCGGCGAGIGLYYPGMEIGAVVAVLWAMTEVRGDLLWVTSVLGWTLLVLAAMDWRAFVLADVITLPLIVVGLAVVWWVDPQSVAWHVAGAVAGFGLMVGAAWAYRAVRGQDGLGFGDAKLLAAAGAWVGLAGVGSVLLYGAVLSLGVALAMRAGGGDVSGQTPIPFGVGLAAGFWLTWLYGPLLLGS